MPRLLHSKTFIIFLIFILILIIIALGRESYRYFRINQDIRSLEKRVKDLEANNEELAKMREYFKSKEFLEKEARLKLNLTRPGEKLIIVKQPKGNLGEEASQGENATKKISNIQKWWAYFFENK